MATYMEVTARFKQSGTRHVLFRGFAQSGKQAIRDYCRMPGYDTYRAFTGEALARVKEDLKERTP